MVVSLTGQSYTKNPMSIMNFLHLKNALRTKLGLNSNVAFPVKAEVVSSTSTRKGHSIFTLTQITQYQRTMTHKYLFTLEVETEDPQDKNHAQEVVLVARSARSAALPKHLIAHTRREGAKGKR